MEFYPGFDQDNNLRPMKKIKVEPSSLHNDIKWKVEPKPILFIHVPIIAHEDFNKVVDQLEQKLLEVGWFLLWAESHVEQTEYKIQSFTLKDSQEVQVQELKEIILKEIKENNGY